MEAKQKADELYNRFYQQVADGSHPEENAKQCALIAVEEILNMDIPISEETQADQFYNFWQSVKDHLINR